MNVELLEKVKQHILEEPRRFVMRTWIIKKETAQAEYFRGDEFSCEEIRVPFAECGTAACIGGWACILDGKEDVSRGLEEYRARDILGLGYMAGDRLFSVFSWPGSFRRRYKRATKQATRAKIAAARIDHFIATNGAE